MPSQSGARQETPEQFRSELGELPLDRLLALSDGIYAIALTLLTIDLHLPDEAAQLSGHALFQSLVDTWPRLLSYVTSFTVIAIYWIAHHRAFHMIRRMDSVLLVLSLLQLASIAFLPFPTAVLGQHVGDIVAQEFYYGSLLLAGIVAAAVWWYASAGRRLIHPELSDDFVRYYRRLALSAPVFFILMMGLIGLDMERLINPLILGYIVTFAYTVLILIGDERRAKREAQFEEVVEEEEAGLLTDIS